MGLFVYVLFIRRLRILVLLDSRQQDIATREMFVLKELIQIVNSEDETLKLTNNL